MYSITTFYEGNEMLYVPMPAEKAVEWLERQMIANPDVEVVIVHDPTGWEAELSAYIDNGVMKWGLRPRRVVPFV